MLPARDSVFWDIHTGLPREGPGDNASTRRAYAMCSGLLPTPRVLDIGCGPGMQTLELAKIGGGSIVALDAHYPFLVELQRRANARGLEARIRAVNASMHAMPFQEASFDLVWSEGAMYILGFRQALSAWRTLLKPGGYIAVTEPCWLKRDTRSELKDLFAGYPAMTSAENWLPVIAECGYETIGCFTLPEAAWWDAYYTPMAARLELLRERYRADPEALSVIAAHEREIAAYRTYADYYGYVFFVLRLV